MGVGFSAIANSRNRLGAPSQSTSLSAIYLLMHCFAVLVCRMPKVFVLIERFARDLDGTKSVVSLRDAFGPVILFNESTDCCLDSIAGIRL